MAANSPWADTDLKAHDSLDMSVWVELFPTVTLQIPLSESYFDNGKFVFRQIWALAPSLVISEKLLTYKTWGWNLTPHTFLFFLRVLSLSPGIGLPGSPACWKPTKMRVKFNPPFFIVFSVGLSPWICLMVFSYPCFLCRVASLDLP